MSRVNEFTFHALVLRPTGRSLVPSGRYGSRKGLTGNLQT